MNTSVSFSPASTQAPAPSLLEQNFLAIANNKGEFISLACFLEAQGIQWSDGKTPTSWVPEYGYPLALAVLTGVIMGNTEPNSKTSIADFAKSQGIATILPFSFFAATYGITPYVTPEPSYKGNGEAGTMQASLVSAGLLGMPREKGKLRVRDLIAILAGVNPDLEINTFANNHTCTYSDQVRVALITSGRALRLMIGNMGAEGLGRGNEALIAEVDGGTSLASTFYYTPKP